MTFIFQIEAVCLFLKVWLSKFVSQSSENKQDIFKFSRKAHSKKRDVLVVFKIDECSSVCFKISP